jgi:RHS repeat-associated protein
MSPPRGSVSPASSPTPSPPRSSSLPAPRQPPPAPPLINPTGSPTLDAVADVINRTVAPFQNAPPPEQGAAGWVAQGIGAVTGVIGAPQQLIDTAFASLTAPIAALFPSMPAITLLGMHIGMMHTHTHPPSLIPPAPPVPLPSIGMLVGSGAMAVLGCGMPLARAGDIGISVTCGSLAPPFEVFTGSSNVFVGGARAARILDITKHCDPSAMGPFGIAMAAAGVVAGAAGAIATNSAAVAMQAAADAAVLALKLLAGKDPGLPPGVGALVGPPCPTVMIGGFPCPPIGDMVMGALTKQLKKAFAAFKKMRAARRANADCGNGSHPIYLVTGENFDRFKDFVSGGLFEWRRHYTTARAACDGPLGFGFRHNLQRHLDMRLNRALFYDWDGVELEFPQFAAGSNEVVAHGYVLRRVHQDLERGRYELSTVGEPTLVFEGDRFTEILPLAGMVEGEGEGRRELVLDYDERGWLRAATERAGSSVRRFEFEHDRVGHIVGISEPGAGERGKPAVRFACRFTDAGELHQVRDAGNGLWSHEYDEQHRWTRQIDPRGYGYSFRYDALGRCVYACGDDGLWEAHVEYFPDKKYTRYVEGDGAEYEYHYDQLGFITKIVDPAKGERIRKRDDEGKIVEEIDPGGRKLIFLYDKNGAAVARRDRFGHRHPPESKTPRLRDPFVRRLPDNPLTRLFAGRFAPTLDAMHGASGRLLELPPQLQSLAAEVFRLRPMGAPRPAEPRITRDPMGRIVHEVDDLGRVRQRSYDPSGNEIARLDRDGSAYRRETTSWNLLGARIDPLGNTTRYRYDNIEQMTALIDPLGNVSEWSYDACQRVIAVSRHGRVRDRYDYDDHDHFVAKRDGDGELIYENLEWADNHLVARRRLAEGGEQRFAYDERGRLTEASTEDHQILMAHDMRGRRALDVRDGVGLRRLSYNETEHVLLFGRFEYISKRGRDGTLELIAPNGVVSRVRNSGDGILLHERGNGAQEWLQFDHEGQLGARLSLRRGPDGRYGSWTANYVYSGEGDLLRVIDSARGTVQYQVDAAHRLVGVIHGNGEHQQFEFDAANNLLHTPTLSRLELLEGNRVSASATEVFEHDRRDRVAGRRQRDGGRVRYRWNSLDMLIGCELEHANGQRSWRADYDAIGRRLYTESEDGRREFYWDGDRLAAEIDGDGRLRIYLYAGYEALVPLAFIDYPNVEAAPESGTLYQVYCDGTGMPLHIEDAAKQIVWWASRADPWGQLDIHASKRLDYDLRWPGHYFDRETGLHYNRYRYYDPSLGRYLTPDPIGYRGSEVNLYAYCPNPVVHVDVLGLHPDRVDPGDARKPSPLDQDGPEHPPDTNPPRGDDGLVTREHAEQRVRDATDAHQKWVRGEIDAKRMTYEPACVAAVYDRETGQVFSRHNMDGDAVANPGDFHPLLQKRIETQQAQLEAGQDHFSNPGTHAEVLATDAALKARDARPGATPATAGDMGELVQLPVWSRDKLRNRQMGIDGTTDAPCCGHCAPITRGTDNIPGDARRLKRVGQTNEPKDWDYAD